LTNGIGFFQLTPSLFTYENISRVDAKGVNANLALNLPKGFTPSVSYTYTKREDDQGREVGGFPKHAAFVKLAWANPRLGLRANIRGNLNGKVPQSIGATTYTPKYNLWGAQASKKITTKGQYAFNIYAQVSNMFDKQDIYAISSATGNPVTTEVLPIWNAPRTYLAGITIDMDWTR
jgi:outer membrane receptor for ferrienterochelin and colicin